MNAMKTAFRSLKKLCPKILVALIFLFFLPSVIRSQSQLLLPHGLAADAKIDAADLAEFEQAKKTFKGFQVESVEEYVKMKQYLAQRIAGMQFTHEFQTANGQLIQCIAIGSQPSIKRLGIDAVGIQTPKVSPSVLHPQNGAMAPIPDAAKQAALRDPGADFGMDGSLDSEGRVRRCPSGSIPIIIPTLEELCRSKRFQGGALKFPRRNRFAPKSNSENPHSKLLLPPPPTETHEHADAEMEIANQGLGGVFGIWQPGVQDSTEFSLGQLWVEGGTGVGSDFQTVEAGWQVYYGNGISGYGDWQPHLFIYSTTDNYLDANEVDHYNNHDNEFCQMSSAVTLGAALTPSAVDSHLKFIQLLFYHDPDSKNWWFAYGNTWVGFYPDTLFNASGISNMASDIAVGGEVYYDNTGQIHPTTQMGSGRFPAQGYGLSASVEGMFYYNMNNQAIYADNPSLQAEATKYYQVALNPSGGVTEVLFGGPGEVDGSATLADQGEIASPLGIAVDITGNVYVANSYDSTIVKITPSGVETILAGNPNMPGDQDGLGGVAEFSAPTGIAVDLFANVYVADTGNNAIRRIDPNGNVSTLIQSDAGLNAPEGIAIDMMGNIYVADSGNSLIRTVTSGTLETFAGVPGSSGAADGSRLAAQFNFPIGLAVDVMGNIYVADSGNSTIRKVTLSTGAVTTIASLAGNLGDDDGAGTNAQFEHASGVAVDVGGNIYVADYLNDEIRKVTSGGVVSTVVGQHYVEGFNDGIWTSALFNGPFAVAVDVSGGVFVADTGNDAIRELFPEDTPVAINPLSKIFGFLGGLFSFNVTGPPNASVVIQASSDLRSWINIQTNILGSGPVTVSDPQSSTNSTRYYRALMQQDL